jgi:methylase of polypeptide subunit release factors
MKLPEPQDSHFGEAALRKQSHERFLGQLTDLGDTAWATSVAVVRAELERIHHKVKRACSAHEAVSIIPGCEYTVEGLTVLPGVFLPTRVSQWYANQLRRSGITGRVLEIGTGTGIIARILEPHCDLLIATDISERAIRCARHNLPDRRVHLMRCDLFEGVKASFDHVVWSPPFFLGAPRTPIERTWLFGTTAALFHRFASQVISRLLPHGQVHVYFSSLDPVGKRIWMDYFGQVTTEVARLRVGKEIVTYLRTINSE